MMRIGLAIAIAAFIYGMALGVGSLLYTTGVIATGATHNDCDNFKADIAKEQGIDEGDVPQSAIKARAEECLAGHELTKGEAFRTEYLIWSIWPAAVCAMIFLVWPRWAATLHRQEEAELAAKASRLTMGL